MREPAVGQEFWLSFAKGVDYGALLEAQGGPVVLAEAGATSTAPSLAAHLGVSVTLQDGCAYTPSSKLVDVVFGTTPAVRVHSGESKTFVTGGHSYNVWASSRPDQGFAIVVYRAD